jgi:molybdopterin/thiamine biosynthesis adenylyltransferase
MNDAQLLRYGRHILLNEIGIEGQMGILGGRVLIIGLGGLGSPAALYLAASGAGHITLCDPDRIELGNLQRQIAHQTSRIGQSKVSSARTAMLDINPEIVCIEVFSRAAPEQLDSLVAAADVVLDCSDNFATRYLINRTCLAHKKPLVSGAAMLFSGQVAVFDFRQENMPCYNCLFAEEAESEELRCSTSGIFAPLAGMIGSIQAAETLKLLAGVNSGLSGKLLTVDALNMDIKKSAFQRDPGCTVCI